MKLMNSRRNKIFKVVAACTLVLFGSSASASAMVVSDPTSYTYYVEQLKKAQDQVKKLEKGNKSLSQIQNFSNMINKDLVGSYNRAAGLVGDVKKIQNTLKSNPSTLQGEATKWLGISNSGIGGGVETGSLTEKALRWLQGSKEPLHKDKNGYAKAEEILDRAFRDPRKISPREMLRDLDKQYQFKQAALKESIIKADEIMNGMPERMEKIGQLVSQIDQTKNIKDSMDLNNRFQAEILMVLAAHLQLAAQLGASQALLQFKGVQDDALVLRAKEIDKADNLFKKDTANEAWIRSQGVDPHNITDDDLRKMMGID